MTEPTPAEIMRRLDDVTRTLASTVQDLRTERDRVDRDYVRLEWFKEARERDRVEVRTVAREVDDMKDLRASDATFRRQALVGLGLAAFAAIASFAIALFNLLTGG